MNMIYLKFLPNEILDLIFKKLNKLQKIFLNKEFYTKNHYLIKNLIEPKLYENYLRDIIRLDYVLIFDEIIKEKFKYWMLYNKSIKYQNLIFSNYFSYINYLIHKYNSHKIKEKIILNLKKNNSMEKWNEKPKNLKNNYWTK